MGDLNGDTYPDVVASVYSNNVSVLLGDGTGGFGPNTDFATGAIPVSVAVGDLNGDGNPDLAVANYGSGNVSVLLGTVRAASARRPTSLLPTPRLVAVGD